ncbi:hypothetical protein IAD21_02819 [Abditibacteriota bacterium]|nr:hypothetical protein IAD21_02819 [Abditibacteriota bacterium]
MKNPTVAYVAGAIAVVAVLGVLRLKPWQNKSGPTPIVSNANTAQGPTVSGEPQEVKVGFLPVTCHLTCPVTDFATRTSKANHFASMRFTDFPTVVDALKAKRIEATFMIVPLAMKLREQGVPVKIVYLGHRDGSEVIVRKDSPAKDLRALRGKTFAVPSKYSNQYLVIRALMERQGVAESDIKFVEMAPPDMPGALATGSIDAYFVGEPHAAKAEMDGTGRVLYYAKDIWPHFISCALVVHEDLINSKPEVVRDLVRGIAQSGEWAETHRVQAATLVAPYYRQKEKLLKFVLTTPPDRVSYRMLTPTDEDLQKIEDAAVKSGILKNDVPIKELVDRQFIPKDIKPANIVMPAKSGGPS